MNLKMALAPFLALLVTPAHANEGKDSACKNPHIYSKVGQEKGITIKICSIKLSARLVEVVSIYRVGDFSYSFLLDYGNGDAETNLRSLNFDPEKNIPNLDNVVSHKAKRITAVDDMAIDFFRDDLEAVEYNRDAPKYIYIHDLSRVLWRNSRFSSRPVGIHNGIFTLK